MSRKVPIVPTLIVLAAVAVMIRLGLWQLDRLAEKEAMLTQYASVKQESGTQPWPTDGSRPLPYARVSANCVRVGSITPQSGKNAARQSGWAQVADCVLASGGRAQVVLGWSARPDAVTWGGGRVTGTYLARGKDGNAIIADPPLAGLQANARPDPRGIPNNHLAYAVQWFAFAAVALVIYVLALAKRSRD